MAVRFQDDRNSHVLRSDDLVQIGEKRSTVRRALAAIRFRLPRAAADSPCFTAGVSGVPETRWVCATPLVRAPFCSESRGRPRGLTAGDSPRRTGPFAVRAVGDSPIPYSCAPLSRAARATLEAAGLPIGRDLPSSSVQTDVGASLDEQRLPALDEWQAVAAMSARSGQSSTIDRAR